MAVVVCPSCQNIEEAQPKSEPCTVCFRYGVAYLFSTREEALEWLETIGPKYDSTSRN